MISIACSNNGTCLTKRLMNVQSIIVDGTGVY